MDIESVVNKIYEKDLNRNVFVNKCYIKNWKKKMKFLLVYDASTATIGLLNGDTNNKIFSRLPARYARGRAISLLPWSKC